MALADGVVMGMVPLGVRQVDIVRKASHFAIFCWTDEQRPMVRHQTVGEQLKLESIVRLDKDLLERLVIGRLVKDRRSEVSSVEHVVAMPCGIGSFWTSHSFGGRRVVTRATTNDNSGQRLPSQPKRYRTPFLDQSTKKVPDTLSRPGRPSRLTTARSNSPARTP